MGAERESRADTIATPVLIATLEVAAIDNGALAHPDQAVPTGQKVSGGTPSERAVRGFGIGAASLMLPVRFDEKPSVEPAPEAGQPGGAASATTLETGVIVIDDDESDAERDRRAGSNEQIRRPTQGSRRRTGLV